MKLIGHIVVNVRPRTIRYGEIWPFLGDYERNGDFTPVVGSPRSGRQNPEVMRRFSGSSSRMLVGASMFWRGKFWRRRRIYSDEGFSVSTGARDAIVYREGNRKMTISVLDGSGVYEETIGRWDDNPTQKIANEERMRIAENIRRAFESQGLSIYFVERQQQQRS